MWDNLILLLPDSLHTYCIMPLLELCSTAKGCLGLDSKCWTHSGSM